VYAWIAAHVQPVLYINDIYGFTGEVLSAKAEIFDENKSLKPTPTSVMMNIYRAIHEERCLNNDSLLAMLRDKK
jgi:hypothetical protein